MLLIKPFCEFHRRGHDLFENAFFSVERVVLLQKRNPDILEKHDLSAGV